ncbi:YraN family protein [Croceitalea sp. MTPC9]|uniref:YraN family protein n=1 Tax=unclassified Croceitalea TaxID=2632280 RepID=UPI002B369253|nr:YraN family protein [Croceitalea sp. MTPC6]GMN18210.1 YraN family protein [Croceitalea sp. MTPC9]
MGKHNEFGKLGEQKALDFLLKNGYEIKYKNYRYLKAEIDIIAKKGNILAIVEVKSRSSEFLENIAETVNQKKINLLVSAADHYVTENDLDIDVRFDIITILKKGKQFQLEHLKDAFYHF